MKFEKLNESNGKGRTIFLYGLITGVGLLIIFNLFLTKAKYKVVDNVKLVNSTINYSNADLNVIAMYKNDGYGNEAIETIPIGNYELSSDSYCIVKDSKNKIYNAMEYKENKVYIGIDKKGTKCYVYFDKIIPASEKQLADLDLTVSETGCPAIDESTGEVIETLSNETSADLLCQAKDNDGITYYFRGVPTKNWVKIGDYYWQIIRINGDGSIRLIYNGSSTNRTAEDTVATSVTNKYYNGSYGDNAYVGFMYGTPNASSYDEVHANTNPSNILKELQIWYDNYFPADYKKYLDGNAGFCNDRTPYASESGGTPDKVNKGFGSNGTTYYGAYVRIRTNKKPSFKCPQENDLFTTPGSEKGNKELSVNNEAVPVGLITADEVMFAGSGYGDSDYTNTTYYLYNGQHFWTMSPYRATLAVVLYVNTGGYLYVNNVSNSSNMRPVINLKANTPFIEGGDGSSTKPFTVKLT